MRRPGPRIVVALAACLLVGLAAPARADEEKTGDAPADDHEAAAHQGHKHHIGIFLGSTEENGEHAETLGVEYLYLFRKPRWLMAGALVEHVGGDVDAQLALGLVFFRPWRGLRFVAGPGIERRDGHNDYLFRAGIGYYFQITQRVSLLPEWNVDSFRDNADRVFGLTVGFGF